MVDPEPVITKIILLINSTFDDRDYKRFGIEIMKGNGFNVEVWDFFPFLRPKAYEQLKKYTRHSSANYVPFKTFNTLQEVESGFASLGSDSFILFIFHLDEESASVYRAISKTPLKYGILSDNAIPSPKSSFLHLKPTRAKMKELTPTKFYAALCRRNPFIYRGIKPATVIIAGGSQSVKTCHVKDKNTHILWAHTLDYDVFLDQRGVPPKLEEIKTGVFLDCFYPFHPDNIRAGAKPYTTKEEYYPSLRHFFDVLETRYKVQVIIAAHPRSNYGATDRSYGNRPVVLGKTAELVRNSQFVLNHWSTSVNYAVLYHKPVLFISTEQIEASRDWPYMLAMPRWFHKRPVNIDKPSPIDWAKEMVVDPAVYSSYREAFIKKPGSPEKPLWQIFSDYIKSTNG